MKFQFNLPTKIVFERNVTEKVATYVQECGMNKVLILTDKGILQAGLLEKVYQSLKRANIPYVLFDEVEPNPKDRDCDHAAQFAKEHQINGLVAVGGGSVIDTAKAVGVVLTHGGSINDWDGDFTLNHEITPLICIPTTAGTGSEVTYISVITDTIRKVKMGIVDTKLSPKVALLDPELTRNLPAPITASTGMDALTHAIESYTSRPASPITDAFALHAIRLIRGHLSEAVHNGKENLVAREQMLIASLIAGAAFGNADVGSVHCISEAIGGLYDTPHGVANSIFLPYVFAHNIDAHPERYARIAYLLGADKSLSAEEAAQRGVEILFALSAEVGIPKFYELPNVNPDDFPKIAEVAKNTPMDQSNVKEMTVDDYLDIITKAYYEEDDQS